MNDVLSIALLAIYIIGLIPFAALTVYAAVVRRPDGKRANSWSDAAQIAIFSLLWPIAMLVVAACCIVLAYAPTGTHDAESRRVRRASRAAWVKMVNNAHKVPAAS